MYSLDEYHKLVSKYGGYASWAIWDKLDSHNTEVIDNNIDLLRSKFVLLGLNISRPLTKNWSNFHDNSHARKLRFACNDTVLRGSYMTDIFKGIVEPKSTFLNNNLTESIIKKNVEFFNQEMKDIKINVETKFIVFGTPTSTIAKYFDKYFKQNYKNEIVYYYHYSYYGLTDKDWVSGFWKKINLKK